MLTVYVSFYNIRFLCIYNTFFKTHCHQHMSISIQIKLLIFIAVNFTITTFFQIKFVFR